MSKILIGSPIKQRASILKEFLTGLEEADKGSNTVSYYFVDDNTEQESTDILNEFADKYDVILKKGKDLFDVSAFGSDNDYNGHNWKAVNLAKITEYKNSMIKQCVENDFDYLFLIDSDIIIDKRTIPQLLSDNVEIVSNVFWNQWRKNGILTPQCFWIPDIYIQEKEFNIPYSFDEAHKIKMDVIEQLKSPGLYVVKGLGACTMIARSALEKGVSFKEIYNLDIPGEDRPFCIRAGALGITLYMDTFYPAYHCNRELFLDRVDEYKRDGWKFDMCQTFEEVPVIKQNFIKRFLLRIGKKLVREFSA